MGAIVGNNNIVNTVRMMRTPYWNIYNAQGKREAGNVIFSWQNGNEAGEDAAMENSLADLQRFLPNLAPGRYIFTAFKKPGDKRGGIDTDIEVNGYMDGGSAVAGFNQPTGDLHHEAVGAITSANLGEVIAFELNKIREKEKIEKEITDLKTENAELKKQVNDNGGVFEDGIKALGSMAWPYIKNSPDTKQMFATIAGIYLNKNKPAPKASTQQVQVDQPEHSDEEVAKGRLAAALEQLGDGNPDLIAQMEALAKMKKEDPDTFNAGIEALTIPIDND